MLILISIKAYHTLVQRGNLEPGNIVLIHAACTGIGMACIAVASSMNCNVFVTVANTDQKSFLLRNFPGVRKFFKLISNSINFFWFFLLNE